MTMLSVAEARAKARKRLHSSMAAWAASWRAVDEKATTAGLDIDWQDRSWARIGRQRIPIRLRLTTPDEAAAFVGGETARDWASLRDRAAVIRQRLGGGADATAPV